MSGALAGSGIDADDDAGPAAVAVGKRRGVGRDPADRAVDRVQVHVEWPVGSCAPYFTCTSIAASEISRKKSERQYHCIPAGYSASNALCSTLNGIGWMPTKQRRAERPDRGQHLVGLVVRPGVAPHDAARLAAPQLLGERRRGRDVSSAIQPSSSSGSEGSSSRYQRMTSAVSARSYSNRAGHDRPVVADVVAAERERG